MDIPESTRWIITKGLRSLVARVFCLAGVFVLFLHGEPSPGNPIRILRQVRRPDHTITMIRFDYASGTASQVVIDERSGEVLLNRKYPGRPQSSRQEFEEAVSIIGHESALASLVAEGAVPEGGFIVDGPPGHAANHRYIQIRLTSPDRRSLLCVALIDLTERTVASAKGSFE